MSTHLIRFVFIALVASLLAACGTSAGGVRIDNPNAPKSGDGGLIKDNVQFVKAEAAPAANDPTGVGLALSFFTPTPCHQFRVTVAQPDSGGRIAVEIYSLMQQGRACALMRTLNPTVANLTLSGLPTGHYSVWVNGAQAVEFDIK
jgi:hypothetical protein